MSTGRIPTSRRATLEKVRSEESVALEKLRVTFCVFSASAGWSNVGWADDLAFFGLQVDSPNKYTLVLLYQTTRAFIGSLVSTVFKPYLVVKVQGDYGSPARHRSASEVALIVVAQASVTVFCVFSEVTDIYLFLKQVDFSILTVLAFIVAEGQITVILSRYRPAPKTNDALFGGEMLLSYSKI